MVDDFVKAKIVMLRGLGYQQKEIADKLGLTLGQVSYNLGEVNEDARKIGDTSTYMKILTAGFSPKLVELASAYEKYSK